ncbi:sugar phosphate isomerase/epimerase [Phototrophicus methaneseepsis]|uniref:Sugar phosphate isomerase/epimerase n=1 Tax=Phototrophicus methaneseepsis TaxID=2710758 RepID=A0A7S8IFL6_9CHLR|nr:sugar phosphate isomerase/epimerase family protein [Phototrophicus methaneseepsis]QPC83727.1 sugar phosphate isomerase/epimerase [Phototrophicus methaneseepsis]
MIGLACATLSCDGFGDTDFVESFRMLPEIGFKYVEFNCWYPSTITPAKMEDLKQRCAETGLIPASIHGTHFGAANDMELSKDTAHKIRLIEAAGELGVTRIGATGASRGSNGGLDAIITVLKEIVPVAEAQGVEIGLENHEGNNLETIEDYERIFEAVDSPNLGIWLDTGHFDASNVDMDDLIDRLHSHVNHIHVKDNEKKGVKSFTRFGDGTTDNYRVIDRMLEKGYSGFITVELSPLDPSTIFEDLVVARKMFKRYETS